jgi:hypothetical protein
VAHIYRKLLVAIAILAVAFCSCAHAAIIPTRSGGPVNFLPVFVGAPYGQRQADFSKPGGSNFVFRGTVTDANPGDTITMRAYLFGTPFAFWYQPGNPAVFEVRGTNLGPADIGGYIVGFDAYDSPSEANFSIAAINIIVIPEPGFIMLLGGLAAGLLARRRMVGGTA